MITFNLKLMLKYVKWNPRGSMEIIKRGDYIVFKDGNSVYNFQINDIRRIYIVESLMEFSVRIQMCKEDKPFVITIPEKGVEGMKNAEALLESFYMALKTQVDYVVFPA